MRSTRWLGLLGLYIGAQALALALALPFRSAGFSSPSSGTNPFTPLLLIAAVVIVPIIILLFARRKSLFTGLRWLLLLAIGAALLITLVETLLIAIPYSLLLPPPSAEITVYPAVALAAVLAAALFLALIMEPQWYVVDLAGFVAAGAVIAILGGSFAILPSFVLLIGLAVYDYIAVYRTKHMLRLADVIVDMKLPILMVMPEDPHYDYPKSPSLEAIRQTPVDERGALFMGLGDVVIPGVLVVAAFVWLPASPVILGIPAGLWTAIGALAGSLVGYAVLMRLVLRGTAHAGLPLLNSGAIVGYLVTFLLVYHSFGFGLTGAL
ncbi:MAG: presenilin family intramembrane aspartyl protease PSH [Thermoplasmata archaeon]